jgi:hypothetical protein
MKNLFLVIVSLLVFNFSQAEDATSIVKQSLEHQKIDEKRAEMKSSLVALKERHKACSEKSKNIKELRDQELKAFYERQKADKNKKTTDQYKKYSEEKAMINRKYMDLRKDIHECQPVKK